MTGLTSLTMLLTTNLSVAQQDVFTALFEKLKLVKNIKPLKRVQPYDVQLTVKEVISQTTRDNAITARTNKAGQELVKLLYQR